MTQSEKLDAVIEGQNKVVEGMNTLATALTKMIENTPQAVGKEEMTKPVGNSVVNRPENEDETRPTSYVPAAFRRVVNEVLSEDFGIRVTDFEDSTDFMVDIIVPEKYSSLTDRDKKMGVEDIRSRIIPRALGENGVRNWCIKIRDNLSKYYGAAGVQSPFSIGNDETPRI